MPLKMAARVTERIAAFIPGESPPDVSTPMHLISYFILPLKI